MAIQLFNCTFVETAVPKPKPIVLDEENEEVEDQINSAEGDRTPIAQSAPLMQTEPQAVTGKPPAFLVTLCFNIILEVEL